GRVVVAPAGHPRPLGGAHPRPRRRSDLPPLVGSPYGLPDVFGARFAPTRLPHLLPRLRGPRRFSFLPESLDGQRLPAVVPPQPVGAGVGQPDPQRRSPPPNGRPADPPPRPHRPPETGQT